MGVQVLFGGHIVRQVCDLGNRFPPLQLVGCSICQEPFSQLSPGNDEEIHPTPTLPLETGMWLVDMKVWGGGICPFSFLVSPQAEGAIGAVPVKPARGRPAPAFVKGANTLRACGLSARIKWKEMRFIL